MANTEWICCLHLFMVYRFFCYHNVFSLSMPSISHAMSHKHKQDKTDGKKVRLMCFNFLLNAHQAKWRIIGFLWNRKPENMSLKNKTYTKIKLKEKPKKCKQTPLTRHVHYTVCFKCLLLTNQTKTSSSNHF